MKIGLIADTHFGSGYHCGKMIDYSVIDSKTGLTERVLSINSRLLDFYESVKYVIDECSKSQVTTIIHAGDVFKTKNPSTTERYFWSLLIKYAEDLDITIRCIAGNHDTGTHLLSAISPEGLLSENFASYLTPTNSIIDDCVFHFQPWATEVTDLRPDNLFHVLISHLTVQGASLGYFDYIIEEGTVPLEKLSKFDLVLSGHIHKPQQIGKKFFYIGSTDRVDFAEKDDQKRFGIFDTEEKTIEFHPIKTREMIQLDYNFVENVNLNSFPTLDHNALVKVNIIYDIGTKSRALSLLEVLKDRNYILNLKFETAQREVRTHSFNYMETVKKYIDAKFTDESINKQVSEKSMKILSQVMETLE